MFRGQNCFSQNLQCDAFALAAATDFPRESEKLTGKGEKCLIAWHLASDFAILWEGVWGAILEKSLLFMNFRLKLLHLPYFYLPSAINGAVGIVFIWWIKNYSMENYNIHSVYLLFVVSRSVRADIKTPEKQTSEQKSTKRALKSNNGKTIKKIMLHQMLAENFRIHSRAL